MWYSVLQCVCWGGKPLPQPVLDASMRLPTYSIVEAGNIERKPARLYLADQLWRTSVIEVVKGVKVVPMNDCNRLSEMIINVEDVQSAMETRFEFHIAERVHSSRQDHWTLKFTRDNLAPMAAAMCMFGHVVDYVKEYRLEECLLSSPNMFEIISGSIGKLEGCYLWNNPRKRGTWVRSGKTSGDTATATFDGRAATHKKNAKSRDQMIASKAYRTYPSREVEPFVQPEGYHENLVTHCAMAFDKTEDKDVLAKLYSHGNRDSIFVWSEEIMAELKAKAGDSLLLQKLQRDAVAYLWELCYDIMLARADNVSESPGFEALGLRDNGKK